MIIPQAWAGQGWSIDNLLVFFEDVGVVTISKQTWIKRNLTGQRMGSVTQFPLVLAYAITCHKSRGLTLPPATVHSSQEHVSGLIYVAISRVKSPEQIQILDFRPQQLLKPPRKSVVTSRCPSCGYVMLTKQKYQFWYFSSRERSISCVKTMILSFFLHNCWMVLQERHLKMRRWQFPWNWRKCTTSCWHTSLFSQLPLKKLRWESWIYWHPRNRMMSTPCDNLCEENNNAIYCLLRERSLEKAKCLALAPLLPDGRKPHDQKSRQDYNWHYSSGFTGMSSSLHIFFTSIEFSCYICVLFDAKSSTPPQRALAVQLTSLVFCQFLEQLGFVEIKQQQEDTMDLMFT